MDSLNVKKTLSRLRFNAEKITNQVKEAIETKKIKKEALDPKDLESLIDMDIFFGPSGDFARIFKKAIFVGLTLENKE